MSNDTTRDLEKLQKMFDALGDKKRRRTALKGAMRNCARKVRKVAVSRLRSSDKITSNKDLEKGIRALPYKKVLGFKTTIAFDKKRGKGFYLSQRLRNKSGASPKPVLLFSEGVTKSRKTRGTGFFRHRKRRTGKMPASNFMSETKRLVVPTITKDMHDSIDQYVVKTAKKYGAI